MQPELTTLRSRLVLEALEDRTTPSSGNFPPGQFPSGNPAVFIDGVFSVDPAGRADTHEMIHRFPANGVGGLNTAESRSEVVNWAPTGSD